jgi:N-acyl-D-aspartate/D-glutamate deacylase
MLDLIIKNVRVVRPNKTAVDLLDLGIKDGKFHTIAPEIAASEAKEVFDGKNLLAFPGRRDVEPQLYADGAVLFEQNGSVFRVFSRSFGRIERQISRRLCLSFGADYVFPH